MNAPADKSSSDRRVSKSAADAQQTGSQTMPAAEKATEKGPETLQQLANRSSYAQYLQQAQRMADNSPQAAEAMQRQAMADARPVIPGRTKPPMQFKGGKIPDRGSVVKLPPPPDGWAKYVQDNKIVEVKNELAVVGYSDQESRILENISAYHALPDNGTVSSYSAQLEKLRDLLTRIEAYREEKASRIYPVLWPLVAAETEIVRTQAYTAAQEHNRTSKTQVRGHFEAELKRVSGDDKKMAQPESKLAAPESATIVKNTLEWALDPNSPVKFYVLTRTGDFTLRVEDSKTEAAYFSTAVDIFGSAAATYDKGDYKSKSNIETIPYGMVAFQKGKSIIIPINQYTTLEALVPYLVHELQHYADKHYGYESQKTLMAQVPPDLEGDHQRILLKALRVFKTEYRAHTYAGQYGSPQERIAGIVRNYKTLSDALRTKEVSAIFMKMAEAYAASIDTEGFNKFNSKNIDAFYEAVDAVGDAAFGLRYLKMTPNKRKVKRVEPGMLTSTPKEVTAIIAQIQKLRPAEAGYILNAKQWQEKLKNHFNHKARVEINAALKERSAVKL